MCSITILKHCSAESMHIKESCSACQCDLHLRDTVHIKIMIYAVSVKWMVPHLMVLLSQVLECLRSLCLFSKPVTGILRKRTTSLVVLAKQLLSLSSCRK